jgi:hypothetical protein
MSAVNWGALRDHLVASRLAGDVATTPGNTLDNCGRMLAGHPEYTFGLPDWRDATLDEAVAAVVALCGGAMRLQHRGPPPELPLGAPAGRDDRDGLGHIDPDLAIEGIRRHRERLAAFVAGGGGRVLLATGHPTGLLPHYAAIARALQAAGSELLAPLDDVRHVGGDGDRRLGLRFLDGVGTVWAGGDLFHSHLAAYMEAMLDDLGGGPGVVDLVIADHGMAGAAIARGLNTLAIADVNDPALPLAQARGSTDGVLCLDDNLAPRLFVPVTQAVLTW